MQDYDHDVALSFAGEDRHYAQELAELLKNNGYKVFYDEYARVQLWGENLHDKFSEIYKNKSRYCVMFVSEHYARKLWTNHERRNAQARALEESVAYILPVRLDDAEIPGILPTVAYLDLRSMSIDEIYQALAEKLSDSPSQQTTTPSTSTVVEEDSNEFVLLRPEDGKSYFIPLQNVRRDSSEMSLELLPESPEEVAFLRTLQDKLGNRFANSTTLACAYREYSSWVIPQNIVETSSHWELLLNPDSRGQNHNPLFEMNLSGFSSDQIAEMRARRILLDEKLEDVSPVLGQRHGHDQQFLEACIHGMSTSSRELGLSVTASPIPQLYQQFGQNPKRFEKFARLISILYLKLSNTVENVLQLDLELLENTQLRVRFKGIRSQFASNVPPEVLEFEEICSLSK